LEGGDEKGFDAAKAELFEAIGHPNRIKIIEALDQGPLGFAELKKRVGMESSGHLSFHLGKLEHLVAMDPNGQYVLTGEGKEARRMIQTVEAREGGAHPRRTVSVGRPLLALLIIAIVVLAAVAAIQEFEMVNNSVRPPGTTVLDGRVYYYAVIPLTSLPAKGNTTLWFGGVRFMLIPYQPQIFEVHGLLNSTEVVPVTVQPSNGTGATEGIPITLTLYGLPYNVQVRFADGSVETAYHEPSSNSQGIVMFTVGTGSPWFSTHASPRAALSENMTAVTLYVSA